MKKFANGILAEMDRYFTPFMTSLAENRYMLAIRNGVVAAIPVILVGSFFLIIASFPISESQTLNNYLADNNLTQWQTFLWLPYRLTMFIMGLFCVYGMSKALCDEYKIDSLQPTFIVVVIYLASIVGPNYTPPGGPSLAFASLGASSIFGGIFISFFGVELHRLCIKYKINIRLPNQVPPAVAKSFAAVVPMLIGVTLAVILFGILKFDIHTFLLELLSPLQSFLAGNNIGGMIVTILLITMLWSAGIHGVSIIGALARPFWQIALDGNTLLAEGGGVLLSSVEGSSIVVEPFYQWFVWIGGSGATVGLIISMLIIGKSRYGRSITRSSAMPALFNINEPIIFGFPIVLNPILIIPFIISPLVMGIISFLVLQADLVGLPTVLAAWTLPAPIGAFFATLDWRAIILVFAMVIVSTLIWYPFAKIYDNQLVAKELEMLDEKEKAFYLKLKGKTRFTFLWLPDESRAAILKKDPKEIRLLLKDKKKLKAFVKKVQKDV